MSSRVAPRASARFQQELYCEYGNRSIDRSLDRSLRRVSAISHTYNERECEEKLERPWPLWPLRLLRPCIGNIIIYGYRELNQLLTRLDQRTINIIIDHYHNNDSVDSNLEKVVKSKNQ